MPLTLIVLFHTIYTNYVAELYEESGSRFDRWDLWDITGQ